MSEPLPTEGTSSRLRTAIVLRPGEEDCLVITDDEACLVPYAAPFPRPRVERVAPGHLVAISRAPDGSSAIVWRWYDAVVIDAEGDQVLLWEPFHGEVRAHRWDPQRSYRPGSRAYLSAGLPGADWWLSGPAVARPEDADVELSDVEDFFTSLGLL